MNVITCIIWRKDSRGFRFNVLVRLFFSYFLLFPSCLPARSHVPAKSPQFSIRNLCLWVGRICQGASLRNINVRIIGESEFASALETSSDLRGKAQRFGSGSTCYVYGFYEPTLNTVYIAEACSENGRYLDHSGVGCGERTTGQGEERQTIAAGDARGIRGQVSVHPRGMESGAHVGPGRTEDCPAVPRALPQGGCGVRKTVQG